MENLGYLAAIGAAFAWGSYTVPFKKSRSNNFIQFQALMGVGILVSGLILSFLLGYSFNLNLYGLVSGFLWAVANVVSLTAVANLGLSRAVPLMGSLVILGSFLWGTVVFKEIPSGMTIASIGILLIVAGVVLVSATTKVISPNIKRGLIAAIFSGLVWGSQLAPLKIGGLSTTESFFPECLGVFLTAAIIALAGKVKFDKSALGAGLLSGIIWNIGNLLSLFSIALIGLAKALPIAQSAALVAVGWGLYYFKEITGIKQRMQVLLGGIILITGIIVLGLA